MRGRERREKERKRRGGTASDGREQGRAKRPAVWGGAARPKTGQRTPHGVEERSMGGAVRSPDVAAPGSRSDAG